ncbi:MAG: SUMF1/EgtB/PvdO family nonheme iron enzyme [Cyanobacteriota bacterium]
MLRGGSWFNEPRNCRSAYRNSNHPGNRNDNVGFRVCCLPPAPFTARAVGWESSGSARRVQTRSRDQRLAPVAAATPRASLIRTAPAG